MRGAKDELRHRTAYRASLENIRGKWKLYSSAYLEAAIEACYGPGGEYCPYDAGFLDDWEAGELKINKDYIKECLRHGKDDLAAQFNFHQGPFYDFEFEFTMPKHPALDPVPVHAWNFAAERPMTMEFSLFGAGTLGYAYPLMCYRSGLG